MRIMRVGKSRIAKAASSSFYEQEQVRYRE